MKYKRLEIAPLIIPFLVITATAGSVLAVDDFVKSWGEPVDGLIKEGLALFYICHEDQANLERSNGKFRKALELDPDNEDAKKSIEIIRKVLGGNRTEN